MLCASQGIEDCAFAHVGQSNDTNGEGHDLFLGSKAGKSGIDFTAFKSCQAGFATPGSFADNDCVT
jgi:hypothetical protein